MSWIGRIKMIAAELYAYGRMDELSKTFISQGQPAINNSDIFDIASDFSQRFMEVDGHTSTAAAIWDEYVTELQSLVHVDLGVGSEDDDSIYDYEDESYWW